MKHLKTISIVVVLALILSYFLFTPVFTQFIGWKTWPTLENPPSLIRELQTGTQDWSDVDSLVDQLYSGGQYPSLSVAVWVGGEVAWSKVIGYADIDDKLPANFNTQYRIGSSSKAVNATLAARLTQQGLLDLDSPISVYIDYFADKKYPVTTRQLLSHTGGIRHYGTCWCFPIWDYENTSYFDSIEEAVGTFSSSELLFEPGTDFSYSSYGTVLSSGVMESAAKGSYLDLVDSLVATPLGLTGLKPDDQTLAEDRRAAFYDVYADSYKESEFLDSSIKWAGGGFVARPSDLAALGGAWLEARLFSADTRQMFWTPEKLASGEINPQSYALGWRSGMTDIGLSNSEQVKIVHHNGTARGASSNFVVFPEYGMAISVMTNRSTMQGGDPFHTIATQIGRLVIDAKTNANQVH